MLTLQSMRLRTAAFLGFTSESTCLSFISSASRIAVTEAKNESKATYRVFTYDETHLFFVYRGAQQN